MIFSSEPNTEKGTSIILVFIVSFMVSIASKMLLVVFKVWAKKALKRAEKTTEHDIEQNLSALNENQRQEFISWHQKAKYGSFKPQESLEAICRCFSSSVISRKNFSALFGALRIFDTSTPYPSSPFSPSPITDVSEVSPLLYTCNEGQYQQHNASGNPSSSSEPQGVASTAGLVWHLGVRVFNQSPPTFLAGTLDIFRHWRESGEACRIDHGCDPADPLPLEPKEDLTKSLGRGIRYLALLLESSIASILLQAPSKGGLSVLPWPSNLAATYHLL